MFLQTIPFRSLSTLCRKGMKIAKDRITVMLCCNAAGTHKMDILVIGSAKRPRCLGKTWKLESDDDEPECQLAIALAESDELTAAEACDDDSEEVKIMTLKEAKAASAALMLFFEETKCAACLESQKEVSNQLSRMTFTTRTTQASIPSFFKAASRPAVVW
jgi:hypothetical protein